MVESQACSGLPHSAECAGCRGLSDVLGAKATRAEKRRTKQVDRRSARRRGLPVAEPPSRPRHPAGHAASAERGLNRDPSPARSLSPRSSHDALPCRGAAGTSAALPGRSQHRLREVRFGLRRVRRGVPDAGHHDQWKASYRSWALSLLHRLHARLPDGRPRLLRRLPNGD